MLKELHEIFGDTLPERHVFFATKGAPTRAPLFKEFGSWVEFSNAYVRYVAVQKSEVKRKATVKPKEQKDAT